MAKNKRTVYIAKTSAETKRLGFLLAKSVLEAGKRRRALVLALAGELGAGKTNFVQGFAKGLGLEGTVNSPTFVILKKYPLENIKNAGTFYHIDCYRLGSKTDLAQLGIETILPDPANIVAIEWPDIVRSILPKKILNITFEVLGADSRRITFDN